MIERIIKQPAEVRIIDLRFDAAELVSIDGVTVAARGLVPGAPALEAVADNVSGAVARVTLSAGGDGEAYLVTVQATDSAGQVLEAELDVSVIDGAWVLPDGGAPYVTVTRFVQVVGIDKVVRATDLDGSGRIDRGLIIAALTYAQAVADANLASRYRLPLATVPPLVEMAVCDIAHARLYPDGAPEGVADQAKAATRNLERISAGQMQLGVPAAELPVATTDTPILIHKGRRVYPDGLCDY